MRSVKGRPHWSSSDWMFSDDGPFFSRGAPVLSLISAERSPQLHARAQPGSQAPVLEYSRRRCG
jgi:hypothetical protein